MKKYFIVLIVALTATVNGQEIQDAIRYSQDNLNGTARFRAMGGAFGALGGDLSSIGINPAGAAVFTTNQLGFSFTSFNQKNNANFFNNPTRQNDNNFDLNQLGAVFVFQETNLNAKWKKIAVGINYDNANNLDNRTFAAGRNPSTSVANYFLSYANGVPLGNITNLPFTSMNFAEQQAFLGFEGYVINPVDDSSDNTLYASNVPAGGNYFQENFVTSRGMNGKLNFNVAAQYEDFLFLGLNLNAHFVDYRSSQNFFESNTNDGTNGLQRVRFENDLYTYGNGFSFQLGGIAKITDELRAGASYQSPTWLRLNDEFSQFLVSEDRVNGENFSNTVDPRVINIYPAYSLQTPGSFTGSLAYIFGSKGLLSFDYVYKDYSNTQFRSNGSYYTDLNNQMSNIFTATNEFRLGGEYRIKEWSLRGGYRFEESPYKDRLVIGSLTSYSAGVGYNFGSTRLDMAYTNSQRDFNQGFFSQGLTSAARINNIQNNITLTMLFNF
jgi:long-subunit fatty acid transport protein